MGLTCDILVGEQGPSCSAVRQIPANHVLVLAFGTLLSTQGPSISRLTKSTTPSTVTFAAVDQQRLIWRILSLGV